MSLKPPIEIVVPRLGWSMEEGTFVGWLKQDGGSVRPGEALFSIEGDKAVQEIESIDAGILRIADNAPKPGEPVRVGLLLGYLLAEGEEAKAHPPQSQKARDLCKPEPHIGTREKATDPGQRPLKLPLTPQPRMTPCISPRALRVAAELGVDWSSIKGSGRTGRIREKDVRAAARSDPGGVGATRSLIAQRMLKSVRNTAPVTLHTTALADGLAKLRQQLKSTAGSANCYVPSYTDMLVKLAASALEQHPALNAIWEGENLVTSSSIHIGVAVDTEAGLLVPVIRDVPRLSLREIALSSLELIAKARARKLSAGEMHGGTFTVTSLGAFGIDAFTPIINYPQCAVLGIGRIQRQPVAEKGGIVLRHIISLSLTFDHRAFDGAPAARFLQTLTRLIEQESANTPSESTLTASGK